LDCDQSWALMGKSNGLYVSCAQRWDVPFQSFSVFVCKYLCAPIGVVTRPAPFSSWQVEVIDLCESLPRDESENGDAPSDTQELLQNPEKLAELYARYHMSSHSTMLDKKMTP
jgi:hypothetical protein